MSKRKVVCSDFANAELKELYMEEDAYGITDDQRGTGESC